MQGLDGFDSIHYLRNRSDFAIEANRATMTSPLPLRPSAFAVLAALATRSRTGIEILDEIEAAGASILGPGTLYRLLRELRELGWIERVDPPAVSARGDDRTQHHGLTSEGRGVLEAEAIRIRQTLGRAGLLGSPDG
jgi:DNA-binding MarR family transcriptional regulator